MELSSLTSKVRSSQGLRNGLDVSRQHLTHRDPEIDRLREILASVSDFSDFGLVRSDGQS